MDWNALTPHYVDRGSPQQRICSRCGLTTNNFYVLKEESEDTTAAKRDVAPKAKLLVRIPRGEALCIHCAASAQPLPTGTLDSNDADAYAIDNIIERMQQQTMRDGEDEHDQPTSSASPQKTGKGSLLISDVVGTIADFFSGKAFQAVTLSTVSKTWRIGVACNGPLWKRLHEARWPTRAAPKNANMSLFRARVIRLQDFTVYRPEVVRFLKERALHATLTPIEECQFNFRCPLYLENLREVVNESPTQAGGKCPRHCDVCNKQVYPVVSDDEAEHYKRLDACIARLPINVPPLTNVTRLHPITVVGNPWNRAGVAAFVFLKGVIEYVGYNQSSRPWRILHATPSSVNVCMQNTSRTETFVLSFSVYIPSKTDNPTLPPEAFSSEFTVQTPEKEPMFWQFAHLAYDVTDHHGSDDDDENNGEQEDSSQEDLFAEDNLLLTAERTFDDATFFRKLETAVPRGKFSKNLHQGNPQSVLDRRYWDLRHAFADEETDDDDMGMNLFGDSTDDDDF